MMKSILKINDIIRQVYTGYKELFHIRRLLSEIFYEYSIRYNLRYKDDKSLIKYGYKVFSQNDEDGIIEEIFRRIGVKSKFFLEIGAGDGLENNTAFLLLKAWRGVWIEGNLSNVKKIRKTFKDLIDNSQIKIQHSLVTAENVESLLENLQIPRNLDLLTIDIDGNDYWIWENIKKCRPRVVVMEYNAHYESTTGFIAKYNPKFFWDGSIYFGASLKSLELLGNKKNYRLVGCNFTGVNAFFVRKDLLGSKFSKPFTSENHYEPLRSYLSCFKNQYRSSFG